MITIKPLVQSDFEFLMDMHYESIHILEDKPPKQELLNAPNIKKYSDGWGRTGDRALIAWSGEIPVGAVWYRLFNETNKGYGFVDNETPELGIAIRSDYVKQGIGTALMKGIMQKAELEGYNALSLSVDPDNLLAVRLYEKLGFVFCGISGTSWTMKVTL
ncbi:GNAT family N-acetyltransferase [Paenibacillus psychroresistens]|uniref:GNAT family N-acetyltransferase n=1 Tax=Paenibacillus psychroresistens TaxID=1778678 RepID=A0A6B8RLT9_9BACL|nr:GNAT family N-acetyltransferase [Paenibacillus psychroresistens]QGQ96495.1 GNAT family N-acetyltransferase [Paenibacillus psychroresistens]